MKLHLLQPILRKRIVETKDPKDLLAHRDLSIQLQLRPFYTKAKTKK